MKSKIIALLMALSCLLSACAAIGNGQPKEDSLPSLGDGRRPENEKVLISDAINSGSAEKSRGILPDGCEWILYHSGELRINGEKLETSLKTIGSLSEDLKKVTILTLNVSEIGDETCSDLPAVQNVQLGENVRRIGNNAFTKCSTLSKVIMNEGLEEIGNHAFQDCAALWSADIPSGITVMGRELFVDCKALRSITIASDVGEASFAGCTSLTDILFDENCKIIGKNGFTGCTGIRNLVLGKGIERIEERAFSACENIEYIYLPASLKYVGKMVLLNANRINDVECESRQKWNLVQRDKDAFKDSHFYWPTLRETKKS